MSYIPRVARSNNASPGPPTPTPPPPPPPLNRPHANVYTRRKHALSLPSTSSHKHAAPKNWNAVTLRAVARSDHPTPNPVEITSGQVASGLTPAIGRTFSSVGKFSHSRSSRSFPQTSLPGSVCRVRVRDIQAWDAIQDQNMRRTRTTRAQFI